MSDEVRFEVGQRVRFRGGPDGLVGWIHCDSRYAGQVCVATEEWKGGFWRFPGELYPAPMPLEWYVGRRIRSRRHSGEGLVKDVDGELLVVRFERPLGLAGAVGETVPEYAVLEAGQVEEVLS